jgi:hypothetical protein
MKQSRTMSVIEACTGVVVGYSLAVLAQVLAFPLFDLPVTLSNTLGLPLVFTLISIPRTYLLRRVFEAIRMWQQRNVVSSGPEF